MEFEFTVSVQTTESQPSARQNSVPTKTDQVMQSAQKTVEQGEPGQTMPSPQLGFKTPPMGGVLTQAGGSVDTSV
jgi:hypothetical protein